MREIAAVLGLPDKPMEVDVPNNLVSPPFTTWQNLYMHWILEYNYHVALQCRLPVPYRLPSPTDDQCPRGMACKMRNQTSPCCRSTFILTSFIIQFFCSLLFLETEKYAHVTFFFNGGAEKQFENEERHMIPSPKVATYDKEPKMSVHGVAERVAEILKKGEHEFVMCNFAPPDMVRRRCFHHSCHRNNPPRLGTPVYMTLQSLLLPRPTRQWAPSTKPRRRPGIFCSLQPTTGMRNRCVIRKRAPPIQPIPPIQYHS